MTKLKRQSLWGITLILPLLLCVFCFSGYSAKHRAQQQEVRDDLPIVEYKEEDLGALPGDPATGLQWKRRAAFNTVSPGSGAVPVKLGEGVLGTVYDLPMTHVVRQPIPAADLVVIGDVLSAEAILSADYSAVFSQFKVRPVEILKGVAPQSELVVKRSGGAVKFPNGRVIQRGKQFERMPRLGKRYILFLSANKKTADYSIITGYDVSGDVATPLDVPANSQEKKLFELYQNIKLENLINAIKKEVSGK